MIVLARPRKGKKLYLVMSFDPYEHSVEAITLDREAAIREAREAEARRLRWAHESDDDEHDWSINVYEINPWELTDRIREDVRPTLEITKEDDSLCVAPCYPDVVANYDGPCGAEAWKWDYLVIDLGLWRGMAPLFGEDAEVEVNVPTTFAQLTITNSWDAWHFLPHLRHKVFVWEINGSGLYLCRMDENGYPYCNGDVELPWDEPPFVEIEW